MRIFFITGASIGVVGTLGGFLLGTVVCLNVESIRQFISWITNREMFSPELYFLSRLPAEHGRARDDGGGRDVADACRSRRRSIRRSARRGSIRSRRCAMSETAAVADTPHAGTGPPDKDAAPQAAASRSPLTAEGGDALAVSQRRRAGPVSERDRAPLPAGRRRARNPQGRRARGLAGPVGGAGRAVRRRQVDAAARRRPARISGRRRGLYRPGADLDAVRRRSARGCGAPRSASSTSSTTCCRNSRRSRT